MISEQVLSFDPAADFQDLAIGETRSVFVEVEAVDTHGAAVSQVIEFVVTGANDAPAISVADPASFAEAVDAADQNLSQTGTINFDDVDASDTVSISFVPNNDVTWSGGVLPAELVTALNSGALYRGSGCCRARLNRLGILGKLEPRLSVRRRHSCLVLYDLPH